MRTDPAPPDSVGTIAPSPFRIDFSSSLFGVREAVGALCAHLTRAGLDLEETGAVELVTAEVLNNVVEHAYRDASPGPIALTCQQATDGLHFQVIDRGRPMPGGRLPPELLSLAAPDPELLAEGGYGWFIIQDLARDLSYQRTGNRNELTFRMAVALPVWN
ncbi:ATP-binding protein [Pseudooceanicola aestuarii]|uniref:ATP-binding protein n=1 Tax=Pseudooceanicola aestuarii TaxID=2697319 RepID=UPI0013D5F2D4|nr:ATP-binding protein [Pseudooceanicola aestuarii]